MSLTREELISALKQVKRKEFGKQYHTFEINIDEMSSDIIKYLENEIEETNRLENQLVECQRVCKQKQEMIDELRSNPTLKLEDLHEGMWVWDNKFKFYIQIERITRNHIFGYEYYAEFEENRFYKYEVK